MQTMQNPCHEESDTKQVVASTELPRSSVSMLARSKIGLYARACLINPAVGHLPMTMRSACQPRNRPQSQRAAAMIEDARGREYPRHLAVAATLASGLALLLCGSVARAQSVAFINPGKSGEIYWETATQGMQAAAQSLGMTFEVQCAQREPLKTFEIAREMVARPPGKRPEYIVITDDYAVADQLLMIIEAAGLKTFLAYSSIPVNQRVGIGSPRTKYKGWLGSLEPRAEDAGYLTAHALIE